MQSTKVRTDLTWKPNCLLILIPFAVLCRQSYINFNITAKNVSVPNFFFESPFLFLAFSITASQNNFVGRAAVRFSQTKSGFYVDQRLLKNVKFPLLSRRIGSASFNQNCIISQRKLTYFLRGNITVRLTYCLTGLDSAVLLN